MKQVITLQHVKVSSYQSELTTISNCWALQSNACRNLCYCWPFTL